jgi:transposase
MTSVRLPDEHWNTILKFLRICPDVYVGKEPNCRRFVEGVLWISRSGAQWRLLPSAYGNWNTIYKRFARWCEAGVWEALHQYCIQDPDLEALMLDTTVVRAHACAAGASKKTAGKPPKHSGAVVAGSARKSTSVSMRSATRSGFA